MCSNAHDLDSGEDSEPRPATITLEPNWLSCAPNEPKAVAMASAHSHAAALARKAELAARKTTQQQNVQEAAAQDKKEKCEDPDGETTGEAGASKGALKEDEGKAKGKGTLKGKGKGKRNAEGESEEDVKKKAKVASPAGVPEKEGEKGEEEGGEEEEEGGILEKKKKENKKEKKEAKDIDFENALPDEAQRPKWASPSANCWRVSRQDQECRIKVDLLGQCFRIYGGDLSTRGFAWQKHGGAKMAWEVAKKRAGWT